MRTLGTEPNFFEGGSLGETTTANAFASLFELDTMHGTYLVNRLLWDGSEYLPKVVLSGEGRSKWSLYEGSATIRPRERYVEDLGDPGLNLTHSGASKVRLQDIFVAPPLSEVKAYKSSNQQRVPTGAIREMLVKGNVLLIGASQSGKTALAKQTCLWLLEDGFLPILASGAEVKKAHPSAFAKKLSSYLDKLAHRQYRFPASVPSAMRTIPSEKKALVFDDSFVDEERLATLRRFDGKLILFANDLSFSTEKALHPEPASEFRVFRIEQLGHVHRAQLVEKWTELGSGAIACSPAEKQRRQDKLEVGINTVIGRNYVPAYPVYVLAILQGADLESRFDNSLSSHGAFYEVFIKQALQRITNTGEYDILFRFLQHFAYELLQTAAQGVSRSTFLQLYTRFSDDYDLADIGGRSIEILLRAKLVFSNSDDQIGFKYSYQYYYFLAGHLRANLEA